MASSSHVGDSFRAESVPRSEKVMLNVTALAGAWLLFLLIVWLLMAGRWGSYVGFQEVQLYVTEIVLFHVLSLAVLAWRVKRRGLSVPWLWVGPVLALLIWSLVRTIPGLPFGFIALRDFATYGYAVVVFLAVLLHTPFHARLTLLAATSFHAAWVTPLLWNSTVFARAAVLGKTHVFELRTDFDALVAGVLGCVCLLIAATSRRIVERISFAAVGTWSLAVVLLINNRAGLLATVVAGAWTGLSLFRHFTRGRSLSRARRSQVFAGILAVVTLGVAMIVFATPAGKRLAETFDSTSGTAPSGTTNARVQVYRDVLTYMAQSPARAVAGVGMGPDFLADAGTTTNYDPGQTLGVRSPHNFLVGTYARLGLIGAFLQLLTIGVGYVLTWRALAREDEPDDLAWLAALLVVALPVAAAVGVVLESPFGAVPYFWGYGILLSRVATRSRTVTSSLFTSEQRPLATATG